MNNTKARFIIIVLIIIFLVLVGLIALLNNASDENESPPLSIEQAQEAVNDVIEITEVPVLAGPNEAGIDINSAEVKLSQRSIQKLEQVLPYTATVTSPDGIEVEVVIPPVDILSNDWTLLVQIFGPDYQVPEDDPQYEIMKRAFLSGVANTLAFLDLHDINHSEIIIQWADRAVLQNRIDQWLEE